MVVLQKYFFLGSKNQGNFAFKSFVFFLVENMLLLQELEHI